MTAEKLVDNAVDEVRRAGDNIEKMIALRSAQGFMYNGRAPLKDMMRLNAACLKAGEKMQALSDQMHDKERLGPGETRSVR